MIKLEVDDKRLQNAMRELVRRAENPRDAFDEIAEMLLSSIERNFQEEGRYSSPDSVMGGSRKWDDLAAPTKDRRQKYGHWPGKKLQVSGQLASSISSSCGRNFAEIGSNLPYAAIHQFGGKAGRGRKVTLPARPYLVAQEEDVDDALEIIANHLTKGI